MVKRVCVLITIFLISILMVSCKKKEVKYFNDVNEFENIFNNALKYDIRNNEDCEKGHIPSFMCMGGVTDNQKLVDTILVTIKSKDKNIIIISYENDTERLNEIFELLIKNKCYNLYSFYGGYENYANLKGEEFTPEGGCDC